MKQAPQTVPIMSWNAADSSIITIMVPMAGFEQGAVGYISNSSPLFLRLNRENKNMVV